MTVGRRRLSASTLIAQIKKIIRLQQADNFFENRTEHLSCQSGSQRLNNLTLRAQKLYLNYLICWTIRAASLLLLTVVYGLFRKNNNEHGLFRKNKNKHQRFRPPDLTLALVFRFLKVWNSSIVIWVPIIYRFSIKCTLICQILEIRSYVRSNDFLVVQLMEEKLYPGTSGIYSLSTDKYR